MSFAKHGSKKAKFVIFVTFQLLVAFLKNWLQIPSEIFQNATKRFLCFRHNNLDSHSADVYQLTEAIVRTLEHLQSRQSLLEEARVDHEALKAQYEREKRTREDFEIVRFNLNLLIILWNGD